MFVGLVKLIAWVWTQLNKLFYFFIHKNQQPFDLQDSGAPYNVEDHLWRKKTPQTLWCNCRVTQNGRHFRDNCKQYRINYCLSFYIYPRYCSILLDIARYCSMLDIPNHWMNHYIAGNILRPIIIKIFTNVMLKKFQVSIKVWIFIWVTL